MDKKVTISLTIKNEHLKYLDDNAKELGMSRSSFISMVISQHMKSSNLNEILPDLVSVLSDLNKKLGDKEKEV